MIRGCSGRITVRDCRLYNLADMDAFNTFDNPDSCTINHCEVYNISNDNYFSGPHSDFYQV